MSSTPLVSVICLCYNQRDFVSQAIQSVLDQTYSNVELIVIDDASLDGSAETIREILSAHPQVKFISFSENVGNCKAFNSGWKLASGKFVIDLSADDVMHPERIEIQVECFSELDASYGVVFTDCIYINEKGDPFRNHSEYLISKKLLKFIPEGDVFMDVLKRYFVSGPTMMVRNEVLKKLNGYDEALAYEDFDFWVRSSRICNYKYLDQQLTFVRKGHPSKSSTWYAPGDLQLHSTYLVCKKAAGLCKNETERMALRSRLSYEFRQSLFSGNQKEAKLFAELLRQQGGWNLSHSLAALVKMIPLPWRLIRSFYHKIRY